MSSPGKVIVQNVDDDNYGGVSDRLETPFEDVYGNPYPDDDLVEASLVLDNPYGDDLSGYIVSLSASGQGVRIWDNIEKQTEYTSATWAA